MKKQEFIQTYLPLAQKAGEAFRINPVVILAQAAIETGWGQSELCLQYHNFFGITAYGRKNVWWTGGCTQLSAHSLSFRTYPDPLHSFMDYARLIRYAYTDAADASYNPAAFALKIGYSKYISEVNGDNREAYRRMLVSISRDIGKLIAN
ncbi:glucosaminidase domain-containing protein [Parabacteroides sp.]